MEILCNTIALTYRRNSSVEQSKNPIDFQVVALAKGIWKRDITRSF